MIDSEKECDTVAPLKRTGLGFTLIELLIVVAIIGILAAIAVPNFLNAQLRAKIARAESDMRGLVTAVQSYQIDNNTYPLDATDSRGSGQNMGYCPLALTTPIAYVSRIPPDVFRLHENRDDGGSRYFAGMSTPPYWYVHNTKTSGWASSYWVPFILERDASKALKVILASIGPDMKWRVQAGSGEPIRFVEYDSSNGLMSFGDIIKTAP